MSLATPKHVERRQAASFMGGSATLPTFSTAPASRRRVDTLRVRVLSGADLKDDMDVTGAGDPYVVLGVDDGPTQKTSACACTANPSWGDGELFEFELPSDDCELRLQVWDADLVGSDDEMGDGSMRVSLQQLALIGSFYVNVRISLGGTIRLQARVFARSERAAEIAAVRLQCCWRKNKARKVVGKERLQVRAIRRTSRPQFSTAIP